MPASRYPGAALHLARETKPFHFGAVPPHAPRMHNRHVLLYMSATTCDLSPPQTTPPILLHSVVTPLHVVSEGSERHVNDLICQ
jgi:hypothetical protein